MRLISHLTLLAVLTLLLSGCKEKSSPPMPPTSAPPSTSSAPPSMPSPSESSKPSMPSPTADSGKKSSPPSTQQPSGQPPSSSSEQRQQAAEQLKKAGQQVAESGQQMPSGEPSPQEQSSQAGGEWDPMMPDSEQSSESESDVFEESESTASAENDSSPSESSQPQSASDDMMPEDDMMQTADTGAMQSDNDSLNEEIRAAQEALEKAGIELQTAGGMLETASTDAELAQADAQLAKARLSVIIAGQDLLDLQEVLEGSVDEDIFSDAQESLNDANAAIIIATESIFSTRISLPEFEKQQSQGGGSGSQDGDSELDKELNESIAIFEGKILEARNEVIGGTPAPTSSENIPGVVVLGGSDIGGEEEGSFEDADPDNPIVIEQGRMPEGAEIAAVEGNVQVTIPDDIPPPQGDDIVAQQLREAAIAETDPELQKKLWEEYKKYKAGL